MTRKHLPPPEYWNRTAAEFDAIYTRKKGRFAVWLDAVFRHDMFARFEFTMDACCPIEGRTFLDVGCGTGYYSLALARRGAAKVLGLDFSGVMAGICKERAAAEGLKNAEFAQADILAFAPPGPFDVAVAVGLFDYTSEALAVLRKIRSLTKAKVIATFPRARTPRAFLRKIRLGRRGCAVYFYSRRDVERLCAEAGLRIASAKIFGQVRCVEALPTAG